MSTKPKLVTRRTVAVVFLVGALGALIVSATARVFFYLAIAPIVGVAGDEFEGDLGYRAAVAAGGDVNCAVIRAAARAYNDTILDGYLKGLVANRSPWVRWELIALWSRTDQHWRKLLIARALQELGVFRGRVLPFPETGETPAAAVREAEHAIELEVVRQDAQHLPHCD